jgi:hypothetical protein
VTLTGYIRRHLRHPDDFLRMAREREKSLDQLLRFLRLLGVSNPTRFLIPLPLNREVSEALARWKSLWGKDGKI